MGSRSAFTTPLVLVALAAGVALRLLYLDADPDYYSWVGYITDEGRWLAHAREMALFGHLVNSDWLLHLFLAPLFEAIAYIVFIVAGVSMWSARLPTAIAGCVLLVVYWALLRRAVTGWALLAGVLLLALDVDLIELSRVSVPETAAMLAQLGVYGLVVTERPSPYRLFAGGLLLAISAGIKATSLPGVVIFSAIVFWQARSDRWRGGSLRSLLMLWAGFLAPLLLVLIGETICCSGRATTVISNAWLLGHFLKPASPYVAASFFFEAPLAPSINIWGVGVCFVLLGWALGSGEAGNPRARRHLISSAIWCALYAPLMLSLDYFPDRYKAHLLVPMAILLASGLGLAQTWRPHEEAAGARAHPRVRRAAVTVLTVIPAAAVSAPFLAGMALHAGADTTRLTVRVACLVTAVLIAVAIAWRHVPGEYPSRLLLIFPLVAVLGWTSWQRMGSPAAAHFWPSSGDGLASWWFLGVSAAFGFTLLLAWVGRQWTAGRWVALVPVVVLCYSVVGVSRILPSYAAPHYSMKQASQALGRDFADSRGLIATSGAEGLFNGNRLPYRTVLGRTWPLQLPDVIVIAFPFDDHDGRLTREYRLTTSYRLFISPEYSDEVSGTPSRAPEEIVRVYQRVSNLSAGRTQ
jgi:hypothetical protein